VMIFPYAHFNITVPTYMINGVLISLKNLLSLFIFALASFTDFLDGYLARKNNQITTFGKFIDPIADKILVNTLFIVLAFQGVVPIVAVLLMVWRDTMVDGIRMMASAKGVTISAGILGKIKTVAQIITIILLLMNNIPFEFYSLPVADVLVWFSAFISLLSGYSYFVGAKDIIMESK
ncbi:MAG TPA: CDP-diacylglycerol--glycerol-3-phosphate 3-phosphatidyltransferase, partial [Erysipelotrichaceae bacterium]|nr:CDP-diacylglycerol--glycerol-3-phosphate 3-phosphatidyltransferase [Erysipelotrichaceae bacterium]